MSAKLVGTEGTYVVRARSSDCGNCGQEMDKAHRIHLGTGYCAICYPRIFPPRPCHVCGKAARAHRNDTSPTCGSCLRVDRSCLRCGKLTPKASLRVGQQVACAACARYYRAPEPCDVCAVPSTRLSRSTAFPQNGRMCDKCLRAVVGATCSHCRKHRTVNFMTLDRKPLCKTCCASPEATHSCPDCENRVNGIGVGPCMPCAIKRSNVIKQLGAQQVLESPAVRQLYADFTRWGNETGRASKLAAGASRYLPFLVKLDAALVRENAELHEDLICEVFSTEELRQMGLLAQHMAETGFLTDNAAARRRRSEERLLASKREAIAGQSWAEDIALFEKTLSARELPISMRTRKSYVHAAIALMTQSKVLRASQIGQGAVDSLLARKPGSRASLSAFLTHLSEIYGLRLNLKTKSRKPVPLVRQAKYVRAILDVLASSVDRPAHLALTAKLLSRLFNTPMDRILQLRHSDLDNADFKRLKLNGKWLELPEQLHPILAALPSSDWRAGVDLDPLLFEGRMLMDSLSTSAVDYHVKPVVRARRGV